MAAKRQTCLLVFAVISTLAAIGAIIGCIILATQDHPCNCAPISQDIGDPYSAKLLIQNLTQLDAITDFVAKNVDSTNVRKHLLKLTEKFHPAGSEENKEALDYIADTWRSYGLHVVEDKYDVLLSYPDYDNPNFIDLVDGNKRTRISNGTATPLGPPEDQAQQSDYRALVWWNAYAKTGNVTGKLVYVNYCRADDFKIVDENRINVNGTIVLCRYGFGWRGSKVYEAETRGAIGVILYTDPQNYGPPKNHTVHGTTIPGYASDFVYPNSVYMPPVDTQRGSLLQVNEDPETPIYPSKPYTYRWYNETELRKENMLPSIPVMPIGYGDAQAIFEAMGDYNGKTIKPMADYLRFRGALNVTYYVSSDCLFSLNVRTNVTRRPIKNIIGYLWGKDEPDRYVMLGNHVDAWTYGGLDPNSGTAVNMEVSRVLQAAVNMTGWRPRRTIVFCAWDSEEPGLLGSTEWTEEKLKILESRAVALVNVDVAVMGNQTLWVQAVPLVYRAVMEAAKRVDNPNQGEISNNRTTIYDSWVHYSNASYLKYDPSISYLKDDLTVPYMPVPAADSDQFSFLDFVGIPVVNFGYHTAWYNGPYPFYHSSYEVEWTVENLVDQNFTVAAAMVKLWAEVGKNLADSLVIPFNVTDYGAMMVQYVASLNRTLYNEDSIGEIVDNFDSVMSNLTDAAERFLTATVSFQANVDHANSGVGNFSVTQVEALNSRLAKLENAFIDPRGLPKRPVVRHVVFAPSVSNEYSGVVFSGITDSLVQYKTSTEQDKKEEWRKMTNLQLTSAQYTIESAIQLLRLPEGHEAAF